MRTGNATLSAPCLRRAGKRKTALSFIRQLLLEYLKKKYPGLYFVSSTTKVLTDFDRFTEEVDREEFRYAVPDFRLNKALDQWDTLSKRQKAKVEFLCNECCFYGCRDRKRCYEAVSRKNLGEDDPDHCCTAPGAGEGYRFSRAMKNPGFIRQKRSGTSIFPWAFLILRSKAGDWASALVLELASLLHDQAGIPIHVREEMYLDNMLDLF